MNLCKNLLYILISFMFIPTSSYAIKGYGDGLLWYYKDSADGNFIFSADFEIGSVTTDSCGLNGVVENKHIIYFSGGRAEGYPEPIFPSKNSNCKMIQSYIDYNPPKDPYRATYDFNARVVYSGSDCESDLVNLEKAKNISFISRLISDPYYYCDTISGFELRKLR